MSELQHTYEEAEARAIKLAKAAVKEARRKMEAYDNLVAAARAVVEALDRGEFDNDLMRPDMVPAMDTLYALRAAVEAAGE